MIAANVLSKEEFPDFDDETGILPKVDDEEGMMIFLYLHNKFSLNEHLSSRFLTFGFCRSGKQFEFFPDPFNKLFPQNCSYAKNQTMTSSKTFQFT